MAYTTGNKIGETGADNVLAGTYPPAKVVAVDITAGDVIERGTLLSREDDGTYVTLGSGSGEAAAVMAQTTTEDDVIAEVYISGCFYRQKMIVADDYEITDDDEFNLQKNGPILLTDAL